VVLPEGVQLSAQLYRPAPQYVYEQSNLGFGRPVGVVPEYNPSYTIKLQVQKNRPAPEGEEFKFSMPDWFTAAYGEQLLQTVAIPEPLLSTAEPFQLMLCPCCQRQPLRYRIEDSSTSSSAFRCWCRTCLREGWSNTSMATAIEVLMNDEKQRRFQLDLEASVGISMQQHLENLERVGDGSGVPPGLSYPVGTAYPVAPAKPKQAKLRAPRLRAEDLIPAAPLTLDPEVLISYTTVLPETEFVLDPEVEPEDEEEDRE
jgi:hypothetical protein